MPVQRLIVLKTTLELAYGIDPWYVSFILLEAKESPPTKPKITKILGETQMFVFTLPSTQVLVGWGTLESGYPSAPISLLRTVVW